MFMIINNQRVKVNLLKIQLGVTLGKWWNREVPLLISNQNTNLTIIYALVDLCESSRIHMRDDRTSVVQRRKIDALKCKKNIITLPQSPLPQAAQWSASEIPSSASSPVEAREQLEHLTSSAFQGSNPRDLCLTNTPHPIYRGNQQH